MQYRILNLLTFLMLCSLGVKAQDDATTPKATIQKPARDFVMLQLTYDSWLNKPDSINLTGFGHGANAYICYDFPINKSNFSFAAGIGIGTTSLYLKNQQLINTDTGAAAVVRFIPETKDYKTFKFTSTFVEAPFELRYFGNKDNRNVGFKAAIGVRVGTLIAAKTKGKYSIEGSKIAEKENTKRFFNTWRYAATVRLGWGNFTVIGAYDFGSPFKEGKGPDVTPYSVGICITGL